MHSLQTSKCLRIDGKISVLNNNAYQGAPSSAPHLSFCGILSQRSFSFCFCSLWGKCPNLHIATKSFPGPVLHLMDFSIESERKLNVWWGGSIIRSELFSSPLFHGTVPLEPGSVRSTMAYCSLPLTGSWTIYYLKFLWHQMKIPMRKHLQWVGTQWYIIESNWYLLLLSNVCQ